MIKCNVTNFFSSTCDMKLLRRGGDPILVLDFSHPIPSEFSKYLIKNGDCHYVEFDFVHCTEFGVD